MATANTLVPEEDKVESYIKEIRSLMSDAEKLLNLKLNAWDTKEVKPRMEIFHRDLERYDVKWSDAIEDSARLLQSKAFFKVEQVIFLVHGFTNDINFQWMHTLKDAILKDCDVTICICGWGGGADLPKIEYFQAIMNTETAGKWFGEFAHAIKKLVPSVDLWGIGHSLGAHVMGWAGHYGNKSFNRITGLDPAGPGYEEKPSLFRSLNKEDATDMVDVIHTDGCGPPYRHIFHLGTMIPLGTIDFYPNFGIPFLKPEKNAHFYHQLAHTLMIESVTQGDKFKCTEILDGTPSFDTPVKKLKPTDCFAMMGYHADRSDCQHTGLWYLKCDPFDASI